MELTKLMAELATLTPNGVLLTNVYFIDGKWQNVMVKVTDYKSNKELVVVIDNGDEQKAMEQVKRLRDILDTAGRQITPPAGERTTETE